MAIKGKTKSRSRRVVAAPPRPPVYVRKPPIWRRRWFLIGFGTVLAAVILGVVLVSLDNRAEDRLRDRTITAVNRFTSQVAGKFPPPPDSQEQPPTGYAMYPSMVSDLDAVAKGSRDVDGVAKGKSLVDSATASADAIQGIRVTDVIPLDASVGETPGMRGPGTTRVVLSNAQYLIVRSFRLHANVGQLMRQAAQAESAEERRALVEEAKKVAGLAQDLFRTGYGKIISLKSELGILQPTGFIPQQGA